MTNLKRALFLLPVLLPVSIFPAVGNEISHLDNLGPGAEQVRNVPELDLDELSLLEAIHATILYNPQLKIGAVGVEATREGIEVEEGSFDTIIAASGSVAASENPTPIGIDRVISVDNRTESLNASLRRQTKSSALFDFTVSSSGTGDKSMGVTANQAATSVAALTLTYPLWRGRGEYLTTLRLDLARLEFESASLELGNQLDLSILSTIRNYWEYRGATETLQLLEDSEQDSRFLLEQITKLVEADEVTEAELGVIESQVSQRKGSRLAGERNVIQTRAALATSIGIYLSSTPDEHNPVTELPRPHLAENGIDSIPGKAILPYIEKYRKDFAALELRKQIARQTLELASDATNPTLNLVLGGQYRTFEQDDDFLESLGAPSFGPDWSVQLDYSYSLRQTTAKANERIAALGTMQRQIEQDELRRAAEVDFNAAAFSLSQALKAYLEAEERMALSEKNVANERQKFLLDESTLLDVLNVEDQLLRAQLDVISQRVSYSNSLATLMFLSGYMSRISSDTLSENELRRADGLLDELKRAAVTPPGQS